MVVFKAIKEWLSIETSKDLPGEWARRRAAMLERINSVARQTCEPTNYGEHPTPQKPPIAENRKDRSNPEVLQPSKSSRLQYVGEKEWTEGMVVIPWARHDHLQSKRGNTDRTEDPH